MNDRQKTIYIAGPMTGLPDFNFPAFFRAEEELQYRKGWRPINPAQHDIDSGMVEIGELERYVVSEEFNLQDVLLWDLDQVANADAIYMLDGWENSKGANAEIALARALAKEIIYQTEPKPGLPNTGEVRTTSKTGGQKGKKPVQVSALDPLALKRVAEVAGFGAGKYERLNYMRGFDWSLAYDALFRHVLDALNGDDYDEESGLLNLAHAVWQGLALISFFERGIGVDDRYTSIADLRDLQTKSVR